MNSVTKTNRAPSANSQYSGKAPVNPSTGRPPIETDPAKIAADHGGGRFGVLTRIGNEAAALQKEMKETEAALEKARAGAGSVSATAGSRPSGSPLGLGAVRIVFHQLLSLAASGRWAPALMAKVSSEIGRAHV